MRVRTRGFNQDDVTVLEFERAVLVYTRAGRPALISSGLYVRGVRPYAPSTGSMKYVNDPCAVNPRRR